ncbi:GDSL-type esterase/lipase family protein [Thalassotalea sp. PLHSN55]|uniref:GDSL-type esterase/lipase family protein n=1 Tax=Thalassotalea sp. PLHSN55 TaxID=3435888 RepID=UPI003F8576F3
MHLTTKTLLSFLFSISITACTVVVETPPPNYAASVIKQDEGWTKNWWLSRHQEKLEQAKAKNSQVEVVLIGDSITHGWENTGAKVFDQYFDEKKTINLGFSGDRTEHLLWRIDHGAFDHLNPKLTILMIGTNNTGHRMDPAAHVAEGINKIVSEIKTRMPESNVLLLAIFPRHISPNNEMRKRNDEINSQISSFADDERVFYLNVNALFVDEQQEILTNIMPDLLHPNEQGYQLWAQAMQPRIKQLLNK